MSTTAEPEPDSQIVDGLALCEPGALNLGAYVALRLDTAATVAPMRDPVVDLQASAVSPKIYVGVVTRLYPWWDANRPLLQIGLMLIGQGLPTPREGAVVDPSMCTPIFPAAEHPHSREPVHPSKPLPWSNCYHHSFMNTTAFVSRIHKANDFDIHISEDEVDLIMDNAHDDRRREDELIQARDEAQKATPEGLPSAEPLTPQPVAEHLDTTLPPTPRSEFYQHGSETRTSQLDGSMPSEVPDYPDEAADFHILDLMPTGQTRNTIELFLDLTIVSELPNPREYFQDIYTLRRFESEANARLKAEITQSKQRNEDRIQNWMNRADPQAPVGDTIPDPQGTARSEAEAPPVVTGTEDVLAPPIGGSPPEDEVDGTVRPYPPPSLWSRLKAGVLNLWTTLKGWMFSVFRISRSLPQPEP